MKKYLLLPVFIVLTGCASTNEYQQYLDATSKVQQAQNASEAACLLVLAEAMKTANPVS